MRIYESIWPYVVTKNYKKACEGRRNATQAESSNHVYAKVQ